MRSAPASPAGSASGIHSRKLDGFWAKPNLGSSTYLILYYSLSRVNIKFMFSRFCYKHEQNEKGLVDNSLPKHTRQKKGVACIVDMQTYVL